MFRRVGIPVLGIIENMSYLICGKCGEHMPIFGSGGGKQLSMELHAPMLGQIPIDPLLCTGGDTGAPLTLANPDSTVSQVFVQMARAIATTFGDLVFDS